jgi:hypothetical protein
MRLKMLLDTVGQWWRPANGTVSMWDLTMAKVLVKLLTGPIYILSHVERAMSKIRSAASEIQSRAKETIALRNTKQISSTHFTLSHLTFAPTASITFKSQNDNTVLVITKDGDVEWHGKPSEAADTLVRTFQFAVESQQGITKAARRRYYYGACKNILNKAEKMEQNQFLDFLRKQVYNKERRVIMDGLKGEE